MAVRIDRVEREFILGVAAEGKTTARLRASGRSLRCRMSQAGKDKILLLPPEGEMPRMAARETVAVHFDFRGQGIAFTAPVLKASTGGIELGVPEAMYRSLSRRWPRVPPPRDLAVDFILPDAELKLGCPESEEWAEVELPELRQGLDKRSLSVLVESFKAKAQGIAGEGHVVMFKDRGPEDFAEEIASRLGRVFFVPSTQGGLPHADPYPAGRIITRDMAEDFEGPTAMAEGSRLATFLQEKAAAGLKSAVWCPVVYYRYCVGVVRLFSREEGPGALDFRAVDLAWEFSRILAWFLKRHGYFAREGAGASKGTIVDATPAGLLAVIPSDGPRFKPGANLELRLHFAGRSLVCQSRVARRYEEGGTSYYGVAFQGIGAAELAALSQALYGEAEDLVSGEAVH